MIPEIEYFPVKETEKVIFSILIPSWNNLDCLKLCIEGIRENSFYHHQIVVHANEATDGTLEWLKKNNIAFTYSKSNVGVCYGFNAPYSLAISDYICLIDDDMYVCPNWDKPIYEEILKLNHHYFCLSGTVFESKKSTCPVFLTPYDFGKTPLDFNKSDLLEQYDKIESEDWTGGNWYPMVLHRRIWDLVGGLSIEFTPGMYSDPDFMMKLWHAGVRYYRGLANSRTYHFATKTTSRVKKNNGRKQFLLKWGFTSGTLFKYYLKMGHKFEGITPEPEIKGKLRRKIFIDKLKKVFST